jgi:L-threonylcarbamoyladenylate synthase
VKALLARGGVLAIPTESSYGLGADPLNAAGVALVYRIKRREAGKPLPVVVAGPEQLPRLGIAPDLPILKLLCAVWPAPLSAVVPTAIEVPAAAGTGSLAVRVPDCVPLLALLAELGYGLTATSANLAGGEPVLDPAAAARLLAGYDAAVVDGGVLPGGPPSTLVAWEEPGRLVVLRKGRFSVARLRQLLGEVEVREP